MLRRSLLILAILAVGLLTGALTADARGPARGEIVSVTPAAPSWGDVIMFDIDTRRTGNELVIICRHADGPVWPPIVSFYGRFPADDDVTLTLTPNGPPVESTCRVTLANGRHIVDVFDFVVT
jgi:hypothetical protein